MAWTVETLNAAVDAELQVLPADMRAPFHSHFAVDRGVRVGARRERRTSNICAVRLWEMRMKGRDGISRAIYVVASGQRVIVVRAFIKKSQRTPEREIELALRRARGVLT